MSDQTDTTGPSSRRSERGSRPLVRWLTLLAVVTIVTIGSVTTASLPVPPGTAFVGLSPSEGRHLLAYASLTWVLTAVTEPVTYATTARRPYRYYLLVFGLVVGIGIAMELGQGALAHRTASLGDVGVNAVGAGLALLGYELIARIRVARGGTVG